MADAPAPEHAAPKKKGRGKRLFLIVVVLLLGGAGGGGFWWWRQSHATAAAEGAGHEAPDTHGGGIVSLQPFLVNLADRDASRFLRVTIGLVLDEEQVAEIEHSAVQQARARSAILELLTTQESEALVTPDGKTALKKAIAERASSVLHTEVRDVLFTDFVVQF